MLYSRYYPPGTPPTTQEEQARIAAEQVPPEPTTQEDQLKAILEKVQEQGELVVAPEIKPEVISTEAPSPEGGIEQSDTEQPESVETLPEEGGIQVEVSAAIASRTTELADQFTVDQLREMAKEYGLTVPPRIKEENLARMIATHEQGA